MDRREDVNSSTRRGKMASKRFRAWILASAVAICFSVIGCSEDISRIESVDRRGANGSEICVVMGKGARKGQSTIENKGRESENPPF